MRLLTCRWWHDMVASLVSVSLSDEKSKSISTIEERLISILKDGGPLTRDQLVKRMGVPRTTIYDGLKKLIIRNAVVKYPFLTTPRCKCPVARNSSKKQHVKGCPGNRMVRGRPEVLFVVLDDRK